MKRPDEAEVKRQVQATRANPRSLPAAWRESGVAERMAGWIERFVPVKQRKAFRYGDPRWLA